MIFCILATKHQDKDELQRAIYELHRRVDGSEVALVGVNLAWHVKGKLRYKFPTTHQGEPPSLDTVRSILESRGDVDVYLVDVERLWQEQVTSTDHAWATEFVQCSWGWDDRGPLDARESIERMPDHWKYYPMVHERTDDVAALRVTADHPLGFVITYFNPCGYQRLRDNLLSCLRALEWLHDRLVLVECSFFDQTPDLEGVCPNYIHLRTSEVLWHKEAMINIGTEKLLEAGFTQVGWLDGDVVIPLGPQWYAACVRALHERAYIQVFESVTHHYDDLTVSGHGAMAEHLLDGVNPAKCYKTGLGWAIRESVWRAAGWYAHGIFGSGDRLAWLAMWPEFALDRNIQELVQFSGQAKQLPFFREWARVWREAIGGSAGFAEGVDIEAMAHGTKEDRSYHHRELVLNNLGYDPEKHVVMRSNGLLGWTKDAPPELVAAAFNYFANRDEDNLLPKHEEPLDS